MLSRYAAAFAALIVPAACVAQGTASPFNGATEFTWAGDDDRMQLGAMMCSVPQETSTLSCRGASGTRRVELPHEEDESVDGLWYIHRGNNALLVYQLDAGEYSSTAVARLSLNDLSLAWVVDLPSFGIGLPVLVEGNTMYLTASGTVGALDLRSGEVKTMVSDLYTYAQGLRSSGYFGRPRRDGDYIYFPDQVQPDRAVSIYAPR